MKVLFAVNNEGISEAIIKRYQREYKEIISFKNVYYFNAILKEIQRDKTYDRIVISEDLEPFSNNNYDAIDNFIFEKLDNISDEAQDSEGKETSIVLICTDRRTKGSSFLVKIFGIGIYNALMGNDRSMDAVCKLINKPRVKKEAKIYYGIDADDVNYNPQNEDEVSELEIQNILSHFKKLGKNTDKYADSFNNIASQYTDEQLKIVINCLPINVKAVLEEDCPKYQQVMSANGVFQKVGKKVPVEEKINTGIKIDILENKTSQPKMSGPIVIPSSVRTSKNKGIAGPKIIKNNISTKNTTRDNSVSSENNSTSNSEQRKNQTEEITSNNKNTLNDKREVRKAEKIIENNAKIQKKDLSKKSVVSNKEKTTPKMEDKLLTSEKSENKLERRKLNLKVTPKVNEKDVSIKEDKLLDNSPNKKEIKSRKVQVQAEDKGLDLLVSDIEPKEENIQEPAKKGRGRPRKNPIDLTPKAKGKRGRPRKVVEEEKEVSIFGDDEENILPGFEEDTDILENNNEEIRDNTVLEYDNIEENEEKLLPDLEEEYDDDMLPGFEEEEEFDEVEEAEEAEEDDNDMLPGFEEEEEFDEVEEAEVDEDEDDMLPGFEDEEEFDEVEEAEVDEDDMLPGFEDEEEFDEVEEAEEDEDDMLPGFEEEEEFDEVEEAEEDEVEEAEEDDDDMLPGFEDEEKFDEVEEAEVDEDEDDMLPGFEDEEEFDEVEEAEEDDDILLDFEEEDNDEGQLLDYDQYDSEDIEEDDYSDEVDLSELDDLDELDDSSNDLDEDDVEYDDLEEDIEDNENLLSEIDFEEDNSQENDEDFLSEYDEEDEPLLNSDFSNNNSYDSSNTIESIRPQVDYSMSSLNSLLTKDKKIVTFLGTTKNGTSFLVNNLAALFSSAGINTAILDMTKNKNSYYIYTKNEEELRKIAYNSIEKLQNGFAEGIRVDKNLTVYTSLPNDGKDYSNAEPILSTLIQNHSLVLIDCDFDTDPSYFASAGEIYLVQSMDILTIQPLTLFLRDLKAKGVLESEKVRVVINKEIKVKSLTTKTIIGGMSFYNDPAMSFMTELFNKDIVKACSIPFEDNAYSKYLDGMVNCNVTLNGYSKTFISKLRILGDMVYPLVSKQTYGKQTQDYSKNSFSNSMNNTLNQMKKKY